MRRTIRSRFIYVPLTFAAVVAIDVGMSDRAVAQVVQPIEWQPARENTPPVSLASATIGTGPLAILVRNTNSAKGEPPYALADPSGAIQRLIEPVPGANLDSHLGKTVRVKLDTGKTLLSSQLDFDASNRGVVPAAFEGRTSVPRRPLRTADSSSAMTVEEIAVPGESEPIWRDEMEVERPSTSGNVCNCDRCRAARGEVYYSSCPPCQERPGFGSQFGWDGSVCDSLFGRGRSQCRATCGPEGCSIDGYGGYGDMMCGDACGCEMCGGSDRWTRVQSGLIGSAELLLLRGYDSEPDSVRSSTHEAGGRFMLGFMNESGRSWRLRYFRFDHPDYDQGNELNLRYWDLDYAGRFTLGCNWRGELSGGVRWARVNDEFDNRYDPSFGPVIGAELRGPCCIGLDLYGNARQSFQYGKEQNSGFYGTFAISEVQLGVEHGRSVCNGTGFARAFIEAQSWQGVEDEDSEDVGLFGFGFAMGITR